MMKSDVNPMHHANSAPRCTAKSKRSGETCKSPAVRGWTVCRMHGVGGGAGSGKPHPNYRHGERSQEAVGRRRLLNSLIREARNNAIPED